MAKLDPAISTRTEIAKDVIRDGWVKRGHDAAGSICSVPTVTAVGLTLQPVMAKLDPIGADIRHQQHISPSWPGEVPATRGDITANMVAGTSPGHDG